MAEWNEKIEQWVRSRPKESRYNLAQALWWVAHNTRAPMSGASAVFTAFPDEALQIATERPGKSFYGTSALETIMLGLKSGVSSLKCMATVFEVTEKDGLLEAVVRTAVKLEGPAARAMLGEYCLISKEQEAPAPGTYRIEIKKQTEKSWLVKFF